MKVIYSSALVLVIVGLAQAGVFTEGFFRDDKHPGICVIESNVVRPGESIKHPTMDCAEFTCDNSNGMATIETCDPISVLTPPEEFFYKDRDTESKPQCKWRDSQDTSAPFPKCCTRNFSCVL